MRLVARDEGPTGPAGRSDRLTSATGSPADSSSSDSRDSRPRQRERWGMIHGLREIDRALSTDETSVVGPAKGAVRVDGAPRLE